MKSGPLQLKENEYRDDSELKVSETEDQRLGPVLLLAPQPFFTNRGTPLNVKAMLECLSANNYKVTLLTYPFGEELSLPGLKIMRSFKIPGIHSVSVGISLNKFLLDIFFFLTAFRLVWSGKYKILHGVEEGALILSFLKLISFSSPRETKLIYDMDSSMGRQFADSKSFFLKAVSPLVNMLESFFLKRADIVLTVCSALSKEAAKSVEPGKIVQIEDFPADVELGVEEQQTEKLKKEIGLGKEKALVYTGNFHESQGIEMLLEAFKDALKQSDLEVKLVLVGGGSAEDSRYKVILKLIESLGISSHVIMTGNRPLEEMPIFYSLADILLSPRVHGENTPLKIYSYMASEKPIVATDIYSHNQVLSNESAFLAEPNPKGFSEKIVFALKNAETCIEKAESAKNLINSKYNKYEFNKKLLNTYKRLIS